MLVAWDDGTVARIIIGTDTVATHWMPAPDSPYKEKMDAAYAAGVNAAYDDCGHEMPPAHYKTYAEQDAWRRGLKAGYKDCETLAKRI